MHVERLFRQIGLRPKKVKIQGSRRNPGMKDTFDHRGNPKNDLDESNQVDPAFFRGAVAKTRAVHGQTGKKAIATTLPGLEGYNWRNGYLAGIPGLLDCF